MRPHFQLLLGLLWLCAVVAGSALLFIYGQTPAPDQSVPQTWPAQATIAPQGGAPTLLLFAHPRCPCTRATLAELANLLHQAPIKPHALVFFTVPHESVSDPAWTQSELWQSAREIPGLIPRIDIDGAHASLFAANASGHVLLYAPDGRLLFSGGITASRGHQGHSPAQDMVLNKLTPYSHGSASSLTDVFSPLTQGEGQGEGALCLDARHRTQDARSSSSSPPIYGCSLFPTHNPKEGSCP